MLRAYKYRLYPTEEHISIFNQHFGACRFVYNWALENKNKYYEETGKTLKRTDLQKMLAHGLKIENEWLKDVAAQPLIATLFDVESAFKHFFRRVKNGETPGYPKFKSRKNPVQSYQYPQNVKVFFDKKYNIPKVGNIGYVKLPKIGEVPAVLHRTFEGKVKTCTISRTPTNKYYISILVDDGKKLPEKEQFDHSNTVGVDVGIKDFAILSNGEKIENPKYLKNSLKRLKVLQRRLSRKVKGSNNWKKAKLKVARLHEKITNQRNDFQHKISKKLVIENNAIALENLNVSGMVKNHCLAQSISDAAWSSFIEKLQYKADWYGKTIMKIGRFEPSSKTCCICGYINKDLTLDVREWVCPNCKTNHDRDINAAINIRNFAFS